MKTNELYVPVGDRVKYFMVEKYEGTKKAKKAVLLLHGGGSGYIIWDIRMKDYSIMDYLARQRLVVYAVDMRGFGKSTLTCGWEVRIKIVVEDIKKVVECIKKRLNVTKIFLAGGSYGSTVTSTYACKYPDDLEKIALMSAPYAVDKTTLELFKQMAIDVARSGEGYMDKDYNRPTESADPEVIQYITELSKTYCPKLPAGLVFDLLPGDDGRLITDRNIPLITMPTAVIAGEDDEFGCGKIGQQLLNDLGTKNKKLTIIPNSKHATFMDKEGHVPYMKALGEWLLD